MISHYLKPTLLTLAFLATTATYSQAQWLQHTINVSGVSTTSVFAGAPVGGIYSGIVTTTLSNIVDGGGASGVPGVAPANVPLSNLKTDFTNNYLVNSNGKFEAASFGQNDPGDTFKVTMNFGGLTNGYLPGKVTFALVDFDLGERLNNLKAFDALGNQINSGWLNPIAGSPTTAPGAFDLTVSDVVGSVNVANFGTYSFSAGAYNFSAKLVNLDADFQGFETNADIRTITFGYSNVSSGGTSTGYLIGIQAPVPEPSVT